MRPLLWLGLFTATLSGCSSCGASDQTVPFKRGSSVPTRSTVDGGQAAPSTPSAPPREGRRYAAETRRIEVSGRVLELAAGAVRASLEVHLDGQPALLLLTTDAQSKLALMQSQPLGKGWALPVRIAELPTTEGCALSAGGLQALDTNYVVAAADLDCATEPSNPKAVATSAVKRHQWIATLERAPHVLEHLVTSDGLQATLQSRDLDGDKNPDLLLALDVLAAEPDVRIEVKMLNRAGGLARDTSEPEATLLALSDSAKSERKRNPSRALALADQVHAVHQALCREAERAALRIGAEQGLACGASLSAGRALSVRAAVLAAQGKLLDALDAYAQLNSPAYRLTDNDRERARLALESKVENGSVLWQPERAMPSAAPGPAVRRPAIAFIDDTHLLLRGHVAQSYDLTSGTITSTGIANSNLINDPSGQFAITEVFRSCQGYQLRIVHSAQVIVGTVTGDSVSEPLILVAPPPNAAQCPRLPRDLERDAGGFRVLSWTQAGVLLGRGHSLWRLSLDAKAAATEPAQPLDDAASLLSSEHSSELTPDGRYHATLTALGVALHDRVLQRTRLIALPGQGPVETVALSPSMQRLAFVRAGQLFVGTLGNPATAAQPSGVPSPPDPPAPP